MRKILLAGAIGLSLCSPLSANSSEYIVLNSDVIGPYQKYQKDQEIAFRYSYFGKNRETLNESISCYNASTNVMVYKQTYESHILSNGGNHDFSFALPLHAIFGSNGLKIMIKINSSNSTLFSGEGLLKPFALQAEEIEITESSYNFKTEGHSFYISDSKVIQFNDDIRFDYESMKFDHDFYYYLDFEKLSFTSLGKEIKYKEAFLKFHDYNLNFPLVSHTTDNDVIVPLKLTIWNSKVRVSLKDKYYVNPTSLDISDHEKIGFEETSRFFLPKNKADEINESIFMFCLKELGNSKFNLFSNLTYAFSKKAIGSCMNSDFCVIGDYF